MGKRWGREEREYASTHAKSLRPGEFGGKSQSAQQEARVLIWGSRN